MNSSSPRRGSLLAAAAAGSALAVLLYSSTGQDDAHITLWSAWSLAEEGEILNHSGERVEQSSSLLQTLVLAAAYRCTGVHLAWLAWGLGIAAALATVLRLAALARELGFELGGLGAAVCATMPAFAYWQLGLLESSLFSWCAVEMLVQLARVTRGVGRGAWAALATAILALAAVRPEGLVLVVALPAGLAGLALARRSTRAAARPLFLALGLGLAAALALVLLRLALFGRAFPHPVEAKLGAGALFASLGQGVLYLGGRFASPTAVLAVLGLVGALLTSVRDARDGALARLGPALFLLLYLVFVALVGGDWMFGWRFVAHVEPLLALFALRLFARAAPRPRRVLVAVCLAANVVGMVLLGARVGTGRPLWTAWQIDPAVRAFAGPGSAWPERANQVHARDLVAADDLGRVLDALLQTRERVSVLSQQAGLVLFYAARERPGRIEFIDRLGLASAHFDAVRDELGIASGPMGLAWTAEEWVALAAARPEPAFHPDVVFDLDPDFARALYEHGYVVVYEQLGIASGTYASAAEAEAAASGAPGAPWQALTTEERATSERLPFWRSQTRMFEFVAVRAELARAAGLPEIDVALELLGPDVHASRQTLVWNVAQLPWLRFLGRAARGLPASEDPALGVVPFESTLTVFVDGRQDWKPTASDADGAALLRLDAASVERSDEPARALALGREIALQGEKAAQQVLRARAEAGLRAGDRLRLRGWTVGHGPRRIEWHPMDESGHESDVRESGD